MAKQKATKCETCGGVLPARVFGLLATDGTIREYCSPGCKNERQAIPPARIRASKIKRPPKTKRQIEKAMRPSETSVKKGIQDFLDRNGVFNLRLNSGAIKTASGSYVQLCKPGTPDNFFLEGIPVFLEVKKQDEQPSDVQLETHKVIRDNGGLVFVVDSFDDFDFIKLQLARFSRYVDQIRLIVGDIQRQIDFEILEKEKEKK